MVTERQTNMHTNRHTHTLFGKQFQETWRAPSLKTNNTLGTLFHIQGSRKHLKEYVRFVRCLRDPGGNSANSKSPLSNSCGVNSPPQMVIAMKPTFISKLIRQLWPHPYKQHLTSPDKCMYLSKSSFNNHQLLQKVLQQNK